MPSQPSMIIHHISTATVRPPSPSPADKNRRFILTPWDLSMLSTHYIQKGLLFTHLPSSLTSHNILHRLRSSLSAALLHFFPLAGRLVTDQQPDGMYISIDCAAAGAEFIHASADKITVSDVLDPLDVPAFVKSFFPYIGAISHDGHTLPLLAVQVTELVDGVFVGCSFNHAIGDGTSYWHFFNAWAEISRTGKGSEATAVSISRPPVLDRWFIDGAGEPPFKLFFTHPDQFIDRLSPLPLRERMFHFSPESITRMKARANEECDDDSIVISSFQTLSALVWRSITRARRLPAEQKTSCRIAIQNRSRIRPTLSPDYFGNTIYSIPATVEAGELLSNGLGWAARLLNRRVAAHDDGSIRASLRAWHASPAVYSTSMFDKNCVVMGSSPRFDMYGCDFGWGKAAAVRSGAANKFDGKVSSYPGWEGGGSVDLEVCLLPEYMGALEVDVEFMTAVSPPPTRVG